MRLTLGQYVRCTYTLERQEGGSRVPRQDAVPAEKGHALARSQLAGVGRACGGVEACGWWGISHSAIN